MPNISLCDSLFSGALASSCIDPPPTHAHLMAERSRRRRPQRLIVNATIDECNFFIAEVGPHSVARLNAQIDELFNAPHDPDNDASASLANAAYRTTDEVAWHTSLKPDSKYKKVMTVAKKSINENKNSKVCASTNLVKAMARRVRAMETSYMLKHDATWGQRIANFVTTSESTLIEGLILYHIARGLQPKLKTAINKELPRRKNVQGGRPHVSFRPPLGRHRHPHGNDRVDLVRRRRARSDEQSSRRPQPSWYFGGRRSMHENPKGNPACLLHWGVSAWDACACLSMA